MKNYETNPTLSAPINDNTSPDTILPFRTNENQLNPEQLSATSQAIIDYEERYARQMTDSELKAIARAESSFYGIAKRDENGNLFNSAGTVFEKGLTKLLINIFGYTEKKTGLFTSRKRDLSTREANIVEDVLEGTDVIINRLPVDITLNPEKSGKISSINADGEPIDGFSTLGDINGVKISSGFRMTNGNHELKMPVCVILFESADEIEKLPPEDMLYKIQKDPTSFRDLIDDALSSYWDYVDTIEENTA